MNKKQLMELFAVLFDGPWLISPEGFQAVMHGIGNLTRVKTNDDNNQPDVTHPQEGSERKEAQPEASASSPPPKPARIVDSNGLATVGIYGVLGQRIPAWAKDYGYVDYLDIQGSCLRAVNEGAKGIMLAIHSPGGQATGCQDLGDFIKSLSIPTHAYTDAQMCSAAYWLGSSADGLSSSKTANVGSIGVIMPWIDATKLWEDFVLKWEPITNEGATYKGAGGGPSLSKEERAYLQERCDDLAEIFHAHVRESRPTIKQKVFKAGVFFGKGAKDMGLIDDIHTYAQAYDTLLTRVKIHLKAKEQSTIPNSSNNRLESPAPAATESQEQTNDMTPQEQLAALRASNPELFPAAQAEPSAADKERERILALQELSYTPECKVLVDAAIKDGKTTANDIALKILAITRDGNTLSAIETGLRNDTAGAARVANVGSSATGAVTEEAKEEALKGRVQNFFGDRYGTKDKAKQSAYFVNGSN